MSSSLAPPKEWPVEISDKYRPIRILGQGGFASVVLAKSKSTMSQEAPPVAIKVAGTVCPTAAERAYAHREIDILQALSHPNVMKCYDFFEPPPRKKNAPPSSKDGAMILVLSAHKGPTLDSLLQYGGALSTIFSRVVLAQVVDALAYLHCHAVVHRDIKPDNIIVTGAASKQADIWDNPDDITEGAPPHNNNSTSPGAITIREEPPWKRLREKWHITLVDFGFARALTEDDVTQPSLAYRRENTDASFHANHMALLETGSSSRHGAVNPLDRSQGSAACAAGRASLKLSSKRHSSAHSLDNSEGFGLGNSANSSSNRATSQRRGSISHMFRRQMSALGNRQYAAPEILGQVHHETHDTPTGVMDTISEYVADYGLLVDAYSLGYTLRYMVTGVPPQQTVQEAIAQQNGCLPKRFVKTLRGCCCVGANNKEGTTSSATNKRRIRYRRVEDLPKEVQRLLTNLTQRKETKRTSVRAARNYFWIHDVLPLSTAPSGAGRDSAGQSLKAIAYLELSGTYHNRHIVKGVPTVEDLSPESQQTPADVRRPTEQDVSTLLE